MVHHAVAEADRLGIELCFHNCAGWSSSGGPWIKPEHAMQTVVDERDEGEGAGAVRRRLAAAADEAGLLPRHRRAGVSDAGGKTPASSKLDAKALSKGMRCNTACRPTRRKCRPRRSCREDKIVDLTVELGADGKLTWDVPEGDWTILRIGHTPTGAGELIRRPSPGRGLECDKLSREALDVHWAGGVDPILKRLGPLAGKTLNNSLDRQLRGGRQQLDAQVPRGVQQAPRLRSASLPAGAGGPLRRQRRDDRAVPVGFPPHDRRSVRRELLQPFRRALPQERPEVLGRALRRAVRVPRRRARRPTSSWASSGSARRVDTVHSVKLAASVANTHGIPIVGAESFTAIPDDCGKWLAHPGMLKALGDAMWCLGINRYIFHTYAHQPWLDKWPGMTMGQWGTHFGRTNTWWEQSQPWMKYIARSQYLLQQGRTRGRRALLRRRSVAQRRHLSARSSRPRATTTTSSAPI